MNCLFTRGCPISRISDLLDSPLLLIKRWEYYCSCLCIAALASRHEKPLHRCASFVAKACLRRLRPMPFQRDSEVPKSTRDASSEWISAQARGTRPAETEEPEYPVVVHSSTNIKVLLSISSSCIPFLKEMQLFDSPVFSAAELENAFSTDNIKRGAQSSSSLLKMFSCFKFR
jgi:hypothetical protein